MADWADEITRDIVNRSTIFGGDHDLLPTRMMASALRQARAQGWRECASYLFSPNQGEGVSESDAKLWEQCNLEAAKVERGEQ